jgi:hypothetical protein
MFKSIVRLQLLMVGLMMADPTSLFASSITSDYILTVITYAGSIEQIDTYTQPGLDRGPTPEVSRNLSNVFQPYPQSAPGYGFSQDAGAQILGETLAPDSFHGYVKAGAAEVTITQATTTYSDTLGPSAYAFLEVTATDDLFFGSSTLPKGTPVSFQLNVGLDALAGTSGTAATGFPFPIPGDPSYGISPSTCPGAPSGSAGMSMIYNNGPQYGADIFTPLNINTCNHNNDPNAEQSFSGTFQSTVGGDFAIETFFVLQANASVPLATIPLQDWPAPGGAIALNYVTTVNANDTGTISVQVLTPGVTFSSASGATYEPAASPVPEPASLVLLGTGLVAVGSRFRRKIRRH